MPLLDSNRAFTHNLGKSRFISKYSSFEFGGKTQIIFVQKFIIALQLKFWVAVNRPAHAREN